MKNAFFPIAIVATLLLSAFTTYQATEWKISDDYSITFTSKNPKGVFKSLKGEIVFDEDNLGASSFNMSVDAASVNTGNGMKNGHAKSPKWFDVETYPEITFRSKKISKSEEGFEVSGMLTIKEIEKEISFPFTFSDNTFSGSFTVNRVDFKLGPTSGMTGNKAAKELLIEISVPVTQ